MQIYQLHHYNKCCSTYWQWALRNKRAHTHTHIHVEPHQQHNHKWKHAILEWSEDETDGEQQQENRKKWEGKNDALSECEWLLHVRRWENYYYELKWLQLTKRGRERTDKKNIPENSNRAHVGHQRSSQTARHFVYAFDETWKYTRW